MNKNTEITEKLPESVNPERQDNSPEYDVEQTGGLITAGRKNGKKALILAAIAVIAIAVTAVIAVKAGGGGSRYMDTVILGEKHFVDGNYAEAEACFLSAIEMDTSNPRARQDLAYVYAIQGSHDQAKTIYDALYDETGEDIYRTASEQVAGGLLPTGIALIPIPDELKEITAEAFNEYAGTYFYDFATGDYWPEEEYYEIIPWWSYVRLDLSNSGTFTVSANQYEAYTDIHSAAYDIIRCGTAEGAFVCTGKNDDGSYNCKLLSIKGTSQATGSFNIVEGSYYDPTDGNNYDAYFEYKEFNMNHGFANADSFVLSSTGIENVGGGQRFVKEWNHTIGEGL